jgi:hypothetical protein
VPDRTDRPGRTFDAARVVTLAAPLLGLGAFALLEWVTFEDVDLSKGEAELAVWELLIAANVVVWAVLAGVGLRLLGELDSQLPELSPGARRRRRRETAGLLVFTYAAIALLLLLGLLADLPNPEVLDGQVWKNGLLHLVAGAAVAPFLVGLARLRLCAADDYGWSTGARDIERIRYLRRCLRTATASLGAIVALAVIASGALRSAVEAAGKDALPDTFVLVYGAWFTGVLAAIYLYAFGALEARARKILDATAPLPDPDLPSADAFKAMVELRRELAGELELGGDPRKNLEGLVAVLSPLAGALLSRLGEV